MWIGERIKRIRTFRGMTQKDLGIAVGFPERSADVRIAQYESDVRKPKADMIKALAKALDVDPRAIADPDYHNDIGLMYLLFDLENTFGLHPDKIDGEICLRMDIHHKEGFYIYDRLLMWYKAKKDSQDDPDSLTAYEEWKLHFPPVLNRKHQ